MVPIGTPAFWHKILDFFKQEEQFFRKIVSKEK